MAQRTKMRKGERKIEDFDEVLDILRRADTVRLGLNGDPYPYVVPLSFGYEPEGQGGVAVYVHCAKDGWKIDLIKRDNHVCVEADIYHRYLEYGERPNSHLTTIYESFVGFGEAKILEGEEAVRGLDIILDHCGFAGFEYDKDIIGRMAVVKFTLAEVSGKRNLMD